MLYHRLFYNVLTLLHQCAKAQPAGAQQPISRPTIIVLVYFIRSWMAIITAATVVIVVEKYFFTSKK